MTKTSRPIRFASFEPEPLKLLGEVFEEVWAAVAPRFGGDIVDREAARMRLAMLILDLAADHQLGPHQIRRTAERLVRERYSEKLPLQYLRNRVEEPAMSTSDAFTRDSSFAPEALTLIRQCFDECWQEIGGNFSSDTVEAARSKLATILLELAKDGQLSPAELVQTAIGRMREREPQ